MIDFWLNGIDWQSLATEYCNDMGLLTYEAVQMVPPMSGVGEQWQNMAMQLQSHVAMTAFLKTKGMIE